MRDSYWLFVISILIMLPRIVSEFLFRFTSLRVVWVFRIIDIFDITLQTLSLLVLGLYVYSRYIYMRGKEYSMIYLVIVALLIGGHMMHFAANALDMHFREFLNEDPESAMPSSAYTLLHFIDEYLSHAIMFTALILMISMGSLAEIQGEPKSLGTLDKSLILFSGFILGSGLGISAVEASIPLYILMLAIINLTAIAWYSRKHRQKVGHHPFTLYTVTIFITLILSATIYMVLFGSQSPREFIGSFIEEKLKLLLTSSLVYLC